MGSSFEADWAYLQIARELLPHAYGALLDKWRGWWVHCNPDAPFPRWVKTARPYAAPMGRAGTYLGPVHDKHAAQRYIESIENAFDLCRYHHILVQSPAATACAYKELGRCPAPCDGSISMDAYRDLVREAVECGATGVDERCAQFEREMEAASADLIVTFVHQLLP